VDDLITWLFLNARGKHEELATSTLGNVSSYTPATSKVRTMTYMIAAYLLKDSNN
jgi:hypothetical protein